MLETACRLEPDPLSESLRNRNPTNILPLVGLLVIFEEDCYPVTLLVFWHVSLVVH
jgi:hypothetical protein